MSDEQQWRRLGELVEARRRALGLTQEQIAAAGGPSTATQRIIESAKQTSYRGSTLRDLEVALGWLPGSIEAVLSGGEPSPLTAEARQSVAAPLRGRIPGGLPALQQHATGTVTPTGILEARAMLHAVSRALQDAWEEFAYANQRLDQAIEDALAAKQRREALQDRQGQLAELIRRMESDQHGREPSVDEAAATRAGGGYVQVAQEPREATRERPVAPDADAGELGPPQDHRDGADENEDPLWAEYKSTRHEARAEGEQQG